MSTFKFLKTGWLRTLLQNLTARRRIHHTFTIRGYGRGE